MKMDEYIYQLQSALSAAIKEHIETLGEITVRSFPMEIEKVSSVELQANIENIKPHVLLSGNVLDINVEGGASLFQKIENGSMGRMVEFWVKPARIKFNPESEKFEIIDISSFLPIDF